MSINPYTPPTSLGSIRRDRPMLRALVGTILWILAIACGTTVSVVIISIMLVLQLNHAFGSRGSQIISAVTLVSIIVGATTTLVIRAGLRSLLAGRPYLEPNSFTET